LTNLISNALKFTPKGGSVRVRVEAPDGEVRVSVEDTGIGIPPNAMPRLFGKFEQVAEARMTARGPKGTGLGLFICRGIIEAHGRHREEHPVGLRPGLNDVLPLDERRQDEPAIGVAQIGRPAHGAGP
jgi:two-component system phosphate regulon sensor histidine kinase PhoR